MTTATLFEEFQSQCLTHALSINALKFDPNNGFTLKSGRDSPYFFNSALFKTGKDLQVINNLYYQAFNCYNLEEKLKPDVIVGPAYKGIIPSASLVEKIGSETIEYAFNRKEAKKHGEGGEIVGAELAGKRVLLIDDVITAGTAIKEIINIVEAQGGIVVGVLIFMDRQEIAPESEFSAIQQVEKDYDIPVYSTVKFEDLFRLIQQNKAKYEHMLPAMNAYRDRYGVKI